MRVSIETTDDAARERVTHLLQYFLNGHREDIESLQLEVATSRNPLGTRLHRCRLRAQLWHGAPIEVEDVQSHLDLAVTRALERCTRTVRRRHAGSRQRHPA